MEYGAEKLRNYLNEAFEFISPEDKFRKWVGRETVYVVGQDY